MIGDPHKWRFRYWVFLLLDWVIGLWTGWSVGPDGMDQWSARFTFLEVAGMSTTVLSLYTSGIEFGSADFGFSNGYRHIWAQVLSGAWLAMLLLCNIMVTDRWHEINLYVRLLFVISGLFCIRGKSAQINAACAGIYYSLLQPYFYKIYHGRDWKLFVDGYRIMVMMFASSHTKYLREQYLAFCICYQSFIAFRIGLEARFYEFDGTTAWIMKRIVRISSGVFIVSVNYLLRRRRRHLPPGLTGAKFIRLGYLRRMTARQERIRPCQELPGDAFGDPYKAKHLVILSHRWFDPQTCDLISLEYPEGFKLRCLLQNLEAYFSPVRLRSLRLINLLSISMAVYDIYFLGGWDTLIFLDFMCIPQVRVASDGTVIPRSPDERVVFEECLRNMGSLYSVFDVLVMTDVPNGMHEYTESGWCTCEFTIALLGKRLSRFSQERATAQLRASIIQDSLSVLIQDSFSIMDVNAGGCYLRRISEELADKHFSREGDRDVAKAILRSFLMKRLLADAIRSSSSEELRKLLASMDNESLLITLASPVNGSMDTLLHLAVRRGCVGAVEALLLYGAQPTLRNFRGDTPTECFGIPRLSQAASAVRCGRRPSTTPGMCQRSNNVIQLTGAAPEAISFHVEPSEPSSNARSSN